jgi:uncharacterized protein (TIGR02145 family)
MADEQNKKAKKTRGRGLKTKMIRVCVLSLALNIAFGSMSAFLGRLSADEKPGFAKKMADGRKWTLHNLNVKTTQSYCYEDAEPNCEKYGRLYRWESARRVCQSLGDGWRLPTNDEWRQMAKHYGGLREESDDKGKAAYLALLSEGRAGFNALLGGGRSVDGQYARLEAHGFYWTASESDAAKAWFYNFGKGALSLNRHSDGEKQRAFSVRCVRD